MIRKINIANRFIITAFCSILFVLFSWNREPIYDLLKEIKIKSFKADRSVILTDGHVLNKTPLIASTNYIYNNRVPCRYEIVSGDGVLTGNDSTTGKVYNAGSTAGTVSLRLTVPDNRGGTTEEMLDILVLNEAIRR